MTKYVSGSAIAGQLITLDSAVQWGRDMLLFLVHACLFDGQLAHCSPLNPIGQRREARKLTMRRIASLLLYLVLFVGCVRSDLSVTISYGTKPVKNTSSSATLSNVSINGSNSTTVVLDANVNFLVNGSFFVSPTVVSNYWGFLSHIVESYLESYGSSMIRLMCTPQSMCNLVRSYWLFFHLKHMKTYILM
ncbi:hypothetical protein PROFUN_16223 [Planoprotostelium fungivorum]|uniref:Uncharacterized protein n=1 Tax=Planoprotostelium fungivorum TaxID=1890364 RepID=A0A2P6MS13_9EUKA|nr:hypothetical protein PROFUN_16223 [Planoprotostelium fungivorum]